MVFHSIDAIIEKAKASAEIKRVAVAGAELDHVIEAILRAKKDGIAEPYLIGRKEEIKKLVSDFGGDISEEYYIDVPSNDPMEICFKAIELVKQNKADFIMKGNLNTREVLKAVLNKERGLRHDSWLPQTGGFKRSGHHATSNPGTEGSGNPNDLKNLTKHGLR